MLNDAVLKRFKIVNGIAYYGCVGQQDNQTTSQRDYE